MKRITNKIKLFSGSPLEQIEQAGNSRAKRGILVFLRWVLFIACAGVLLSSESFAESRVWSGLVLSLMLVSNLSIAVLPARYLEKRHFDHWLLGLDVLLITSCIWISGGTSSDLYLMYFVSLMLAALVETPRAVALCALVVSGVYLIVCAVAGGLDAVWRAEFLVRVPFFFVVALLYSYIAGLVRQEQKKRVEVQARFEETERMRAIANRLSEAYSPPELFQLLVSETQQFAKADFTAVVSLKELRLIAEVGQWQSAKPEIRRDLLLEILQKQVSNYCRDSMVKGVVAGELAAPKVLGDAWEEKQRSQLCLSADGVTFLPLSGEVDSDIYLVLAGKISEGAIAQVSLLLWSAALAYERTLEIQSLAQELQLRSESDSDVVDECVSLRSFSAWALEELSTPVYSLIGLAELLLKDGYGPLNSPQRDAVLRMAESARGIRDFLKHGVEFMRSSEQSSQQSRAIYGELVQFVREFVSRQNQLRAADQGELLLKIDGRSLNACSLCTDWGLLQEVLSISAHEVSGEDKQPVELIVKSVRGGEAIQFELSPKQKGEITTGEALRDYTFSVRSRLMVWPPPCALPVAVAGTYAARLLADLTVSSEGAYTRRVVITLPVQVSMLELGVVSLQ